MKRFAIILVALAIGLGTGSAHAKANKANKSGKTAKNEQGISGVVSQVSGNNIVVQTKGKKGAAVTIATDANTKFSGGAASLAGIKAGMQVSASPVSGTAQEVTVRAGKDGKKNKGEGKKDKADKKKNKNN